MILKRLRNFPNDFHDDESFESLVDLFTLISISLILATVIYGLKSNLVMETMDVPIKEIVDQAGSTDVSLENVIIIYITNDGVNDKIIFNDSRRGRRVSNVSRENIKSILDGEFSYIANTKEISINYRFERHRHNSSNIY